MTLALNTITSFRAEPTERGIPLGYATAHLNLRVPHPSRLLRRVGSCDLTSLSFLSSLLFLHRVLPPDSLRALRSSLCALCVKSPSSFMRRRFLKARLEFLQASPFSLGGRTFRSAMKCVVQTKLQPLRNLHFSCLNFRFSSVVPRASLLRNYRLPTTDYRLSL